MKKTQAVAGWSERSAGGVGFRDARWRKMDGLSSEFLMQGVMKHLPQQQQQDMLRQWTALFQKSGTNFLQYLSLLQHGKVWRSPTAPLLLCCLPARDNL